VFSTISVERPDSGQTVRMSVGDILEVNLAEDEPTAAWKAEFDQEILGLVSETTGESVYLLSDLHQRTVRQFRAKKEGQTTLRMLYQRFGDAGVATRDTFTLDVVVGHAAPVRKERQPVPLPEMALILVEVFLFAAAFLAISFMFGIYAGQSHSVPSPTKMFIALTGAVLAGSVAGFTLLRLVGMVIHHLFGRED